ncbi:hypothetical protein GCM10010524_31680 [Streptomyces mexicanus]
MVLPGVAHFRAPLPYSDPSASQGRSDLGVPAGHAGLGALPEARPAGASDAPDRRPADRRDRHAREVPKGRG